MCDWTEEETDEFLAAIEEEADRLSELVGNLLDMSRIQDGGAEPRDRQVGLDEVVPKALCEPARTAGVASRWTCRSPCRGSTWTPRCSSGRSRTSSPTRASGAPLDIRSRSRARMRPSVELRVVDRGPRHRPSRIASGSSSRSSGSAIAGGDGVGLGLAVARGFVEAMGGDLRIEDTPGGGLTMVIGSGGGAMTRVLVVDDEPQILRGLGTNLSARGYEVDTAADGESALTIAARRQPDVVILDLGSPRHRRCGGDPRVRAWSKLPIIVLSARDQERDKVVALDAGADDYVTKPFGMNELLARLRAAERRRAPRGGGGHRRDRRVPPRPGGQASDTSDGEEVHLTPTEWHLVEILVRNPGKLVSQRQLLKEVWGPKYEDRDELPAGLHGADPPQARARPAEAPVLHHRAGHGLPVRTRSACAELGQSEAAPSCDPDGAPPG